VLSVLFVFRTATTWPRLLIIASGVPVYFVLRRRLGGSTTLTEGRSIQG
jgi:APA family basic amino acid/polyamine antiporter